MEHHVSSVIRGHHVSKLFWTPAIDEIVTAITEDSNTHDRFAVALSAPGVGVIGHVPRKFSRVVRHFLLHGGMLTKYLGEDNVAKAWKCRVSTPFTVKRSW